MCSKVLEKITTSTMTYHTVSEEQSWLLQNWIPQSQAKSAELLRRAVSDSSSSGWATTDWRNLYDKFRDEQRLRSESALPAQWEKDIWSTLYKG